jgi:hypothetical protein
MKHNIDFVDAITVFNDLAHQAAEVTKPEYENCHGRLSV